jgi:Fic family protein
MDMPALYLSNYILKNRSDYYTKLRNVTEKNEWQNWILYMLDMIETTSETGKQRITKIEKLMYSMGKDIQKKLPKVYSRDLMEELFHLPYTKRNHIAAAGVGTVKTAGIYLMSLEEKGFLKSVVVGKEKLYLNFKLMEILKKE